MHKSKRSAWPIQHRVYTDHQPLQSIFKKDLTLAPKFLQRILLLLQRYDFTVVYRKGSLLHLADTVSRAPCQDEAVNPFMSDTFQMYHVHLARLDPTSAALIDITREQLRNATSSCTCGSINPSTVREELSIVNAILLNSTRAIVPTSLRPSMLSKVAACFPSVESKLPLIILSPPVPTRPW